MKFRMVMVFGFLLILPVWAFLGIVFHERTGTGRHICVFLKNRPTLKVFFWTPPDMSGEEGYLRRLPPDSPEYQAVKDWHEFGVSHDCGVDTPEACL